MDRTYGDAGMKISPADKWFSLSVRERANWTCECCGKKYEINSQGLHCSHFYSRRHRATRWDGMNAAAHCFSCHQRLGGNPLDFARWIENHLGEAGAEILRDKHHGIAKIPKAEEKQIAAHYRAQYVRIVQAREQGAEGRVEFESYQ